VIPSTTIHIDTVHLHMPSPGFLLQAVESKLPADSNEQLQTIEAPDGTVIDAATGLMWSRGTIAKGKTWAEAKEAAAAVRLGGFTDWRLPTRAELLTLVDDTRSDPCIDTSRFDCDSAWYWTATPLASSPSVFAWSVYFSYGFANCYGQTNQGLVRAVRSVVPASPGQ